jgi:predicted MFS family arabinose efflux permease
MRKEFPPCVSYLIVTGMSVALLAVQATIPFKIKALGGDLGAVGLLFLWASCWYVVSGLSLGWISHHAGPRRVMLATLLTCAAMAAGMSGARALWQLYALQTVYSMSLCLFWVATEHASSGLHAHLSLAQSTSIFSVAFSVGNVLGLLVGTTLQGRTMVVPFLVSAALTLAVVALTWVTVSPQAGFQRCCPQDVAAFSEPQRARLRRSLMASRTGMVGVYGAYAVLTLFLPRYLWEQRGFSKPWAGALTAAMLVAMAATFAVHGRFTGWPHRLWLIRLCPFLAAGSVLMAGRCAAPLGIALGAALAGAVAATGYIHNLYYSLEEPGRRARNAGIHEALVGVAFAIPPALSGLGARFLTTPESVFWVGAALAAVSGLVQNFALSRTSDRTAAGHAARPAPTTRPSRSSDP